MGIRISELVSALATSYKCIDVRAAIYEQDDHATVLVLVIRLSYEDAESARARLNQLKLKYDNPSTEHFSILTDVRPFEEWPKLVDELQCGVLSICGSYFLMRGLDIETPEMDIQVNVNDLRPFDGRPWPAALFRAWPNSATMMDDRMLIREVGRIGYADPYEPVNSYCELNVHRNTNPGNIFNLSIPVFARVASLRIPGDYSHIEVDIEHLNNLSDLDARLAVRQGEFLVKEAMKLKQLMELKRSHEQSATLHVSTAKIQVPDLGPNDWIEIRLLNPEIGVIAVESRFAYTCVSPLEVNPLWPALSRFCPKEKMTELLTKPYSVRSKKLKESAAFELHVSWLLSCFGFRPIVLGEYEDLLSETRVKRGSLDILAASETNLLIGACTLGVPKDEDFSNLLHMAEVLRNEVFSGTTTHILPVLFSGATGLGLYKKIGQNEMFGIPIIDCDTSSRLLKLLEKPDAEKSFLAFVASPMLSGLTDNGY